MNRAALAEKYYGMTQEQHDWFMECRGGRYVREMDEALERDDVEEARRCRNALFRWVLTCLTAGTHRLKEDGLPGIEKMVYPEHLWAGWAQCMEIPLGEYQKRKGLAPDETDVEPEEAP
jgi:hypothetical protein